MRRRPRKMLSVRRSNLFDSPTSARLHGRHTHCVSLYIFELRTIHGNDGAEDKPQLRFAASPSGCRGECSQIAGPESA
jgi:hypothetical protein